MRIGFVVNPVAGMGGAVGLKGTDGEEVRKEASRRGAAKSSPLRASSALESVLPELLIADWLTCGGEMGGEELEARGFESKVIHRPPKETSRNDTIETVRKFLKQNVDIIVFVGGDGTARDILEAVDKNVPLIGVPAGVKMQSAVFLNRPEDLGDVLMTFAGSRVTKEVEVLDVNEDSFRKGILETKLYGIAKVPGDPSHLQTSKMSYHSGTADDEAAEIGQYITDTMDPDILYIIGPGSTTSEIARAMGQGKTLLGADAYLNKCQVVCDGGERELLSALDNRRDARIIVSPIGAQGFVFGRGNQQISPRVIWRVGVKNIIIVSTPTKLRESQPLRVDTGDSDLDETLRGRSRVVTGYRRRKLVDVV